MNKAVNWMKFFFDVISSVILSIFFIILRNFFVLHKITYLTLEISEYVSLYAFSSFLEIFQNALKFQFWLLRYLKLCLFLLWSPFHLWPLLLVMDFNFLYKKSEQVFGFTELGFIPLHSEVFFLMLLFFSPVSLSPPFYATFVSCIKK